MARAGVKDSVEQAFAYVKACAKGQASDDACAGLRRDRAGDGRYLRQIGVRYRCDAQVRRLLPHVPGALPGGSHDGPGGLQRTPSSATQALENCGPPTRGS
jgi:3-oxosteroid 1-dehydrogenase